MPSILRIMDRVNPAPNQPTVQRRCSSLVKANKEDLPVWVSPLLNSIVYAIRNHSSPSRALLTISPPYNDKFAIPGPLRQFRHDFLDPEHTRPDFIQHFDQGWASNSKWIQYRCFFRSVILCMLQEHYTP